MLKSVRPHNSNEHVYFENIQICPICNAKISPTYISGQLHLAKTSFSLYCECPSCGKPFIAYFKTIRKESIPTGVKNTAEDIDYLAPNFPAVKTFDNKIKVLSSNFVETYNQSLSAESYNLNQIAGMGYRKALEFLIKDFCIYKNPTENSQICSMPLSQCIETFIADNKIKNLSKVSAWLGNDETHYIKKFEDKDINDLKRFIDTTVYFILYNLNADEANEIVNSQ